MSYICEFGKYIGNKELIYDLYIVKCSKLAELIDPPHHHLHTTPHHTSPPTPYPAATSVGAAPPLPKHTQTHYHTHTHSPSPPLHTPFTTHIPPPRTHARTHTHTHTHHKRLKRLSWRAGSFRYRSPGALQLPATTQTQQATGHIQHTGHTQDTHRSHRSHTHTHTQDTHTGYKQDTHRTHTGHTQVTHRSHTMMLRASHHAHGARRFLMMISVPRFQDLRGLFRVVGCRFIELVPGECPAPTHPTLCTGRTQLHESSAQVTQESCNHNHESFKHHESCRHPTAARPRAGSRTSRAVGPCESCQPTCPAIGPCESCSHTCPAIGPSEHVSIRATIHVRERDVWL